MATTYKKALKSIVITTAGGATVSVADTAQKALASNVLSEFESRSTLHVPAEDGVTVIPFHAVDNIAVEVSESDAITRPDPYGCDEEADSDPDGGGDQDGDQDPDSDPVDPDANPGG